MKFGLFPPLLRKHGYEVVMEKVGGDKRDRTVDPLLARQVLSQLSYTPTLLKDLLILQN